MIKKIIKYFLDLKFKNKIISNLLNFILSEILNQYRLINIYGKKVYLSEVNNWTKSRNIEFFDNEPDTLKWIDSFDNSTQINFFDIGANIGHFSIYAATIHKNIQVVSFEPSVYNQIALVKNVNLNHLNDSISIVGNPLSQLSQIGSLSLPSEQIGAAMNSFEDNKLNINTNFYKMPSISLDNFIRTYGIKPNYLKIDVDGIEDEIIFGSEELLNSNLVKEILIEVDYKSKKSIVVSDFLEQKKFKLKTEYSLNTQLSVSNQLWVYDN